MGSAHSKKAPPVIGSSPFPLYCVKVMGSRHFVVGGGGGAAKTGVPNYIEMFLITYNNFCKLRRSQDDIELTLQAKKTFQIDTDPHSTMNMDVLCVGKPKDGKYLIAAGHDEYTNLYETMGFDVAAEHEGEIDGPSRLMFNCRHVAKFGTDFKSEQPYQKCIRFSKNIDAKGIKLATGGADGVVRIWNISQFLNDRDPTYHKTPVFVLSSHTGEVSDIDIDKEGKFLISVGADMKTIIWDINLGTKLSVLSSPPDLETSHKVRSIRFVNLDSSGRSLVFVVAYQQIRRKSKSSSFLVLFEYSKETAKTRVIEQKEIRDEAISTLGVSDCGRFTSIGSMGGLVAVYDTNSLEQLYYAKETHGIFVTGIEFLPSNTLDTESILPGPASHSKASVLSISADKTIQIHHVPYPKSASTMEFLLKFTVISLLLSLIINWLIQNYLN
uniref:WD_REPEATS_REGION domain-containing protein n=1 Tax=Rhabditophanes sp. KR3021 TaxID=114890 RepID=A0AC35UFL2_9BILA